MEKINQCKIVQAELREDLSGIDMVLKDVVSGFTYHTFSSSEEPWLKTTPEMNKKHELEKVVYLLNTNKNIIVNFVIKNGK